MSPHVPVSAEFAVLKTIQRQMSNKNYQSCKKKIHSWDKLDQQKYSLTITERSSGPFTGDTGADMNAVMDCLKLAAQKAVPSKIAKLKGPRKRVSQKVLECLQSVKTTYREWVCAGKPQHGQIYLENKLAKKCLRQQQ